MLDKFMDKVFIPGVMLMTIGFFIFVVIVLPIHICQEMTAETFELKKAEWTCTESHQVRRYRSQLIGKIIVNQPYTATECIKYERVL